MGWIKRPLRLGINGWPPLATHLTCFFIGTFLVAQAPCDEGTESFSLKKGHILMRVSRSLSKTILRVRKRGWIYIVGSNDGETFCRYHAKSILIRYLGLKKNLYLEFSDLKSLHVLMKETQKPGNYDIRSKRFAQNFPLCEWKPKVYYD